MTAYSQSGCLAADAIARTTFSTPGAVQPPTPTVPPAPSKPVATAGDARVALRWTSGGDGGLPITGWQYVRQAGGATFETAWRDVPGSGPDTIGHTVTGLDNGVGYRFRVRAVNARGAGAASPASEVATPAAAPGAVGVLPDIKLHVGGDPVRVALAPAFSGADLVFDASSSDEAVAAVSVSPSSGGSATLVVTPGALGEASVTVRASNRMGEAVQRFAVTVGEAAPAAAGALPALALVAGGGVREVDVAPFFPPAPISCSPRRPRTPRWWRRRWPGPRSPSRRWPRAAPR